MLRGHSRTPRPEPGQRQQCPRLAAGRSADHRPVEPGRREGPGERRLLDHPVLLAEVLGVLGPGGMRAMGDRDEGGTSSSGSTSTPNWARSTTRPTSTQDVRRRPGGRWSSDACSRRPPPSGNPWLKAVGNSLDARAVMAWRRVGETLAHQAWDGALPKVEANSSTVPSSNTPPDGRHLRRAYDHDV